LHEKMRLSGCWDEGAGITERRDGRIDAMNAVPEVDVEKCCNEIGVSDS
jgi:hypothetical protein